MTVTIRPYAAGDLAAAHAVYADVVTARVPHCFPVAADDLAEVLAAPAGLEREATVLRAQQVWVGADADGVQGFVHAAVQEPGPRLPHVRGVLRMLAYRRGARPVGAALLEQAEVWLRERGSPQVRSIPQPWRYPFYAYAHAYMSDHLDHVQALLRVHGYRKTGGEVFLDWPDMAPVVPAPPAGLDFELAWETQPGDGRREGLQLQAMQGDEDIGTCVLRSAGDFTRDAAVQDVAYCDWLGVREPFQGRGLGRFLLALALREATVRGFHHGAISTAFDNDRAFQFYTHCGFRVVDWTYEFSKDLT